MANSPAAAQAVPCPLTTTQGSRRHKNTCSLCARRKVKCDKDEPCANCLRAGVQCLYEAPVPPRSRKRPADEELLARLASYEELMRKHGIDFVHSDRVLGTPELDFKPQEGDKRSQPSVLEILAIATPDLRAFPSKDTPIRCLWSDLSPELRNPPVQNMRPKDDSLLHPTPSLHSICLADGPELHELHPEPRHIYRLWQIFVDSVNPLMKMIHVPTLQQRVLEASWNVASASRLLTAILFAMYTLSIISMSADDCMNLFGESRNLLLTRYRAATMQALVVNEFLVTRDFEVLQAFVLFLFADPESELTSTLTGAAIRLGQKMGLHSNKPQPKISFFEQEMRVRLWWHLNGLDARTRYPSSKWPKYRPLHHDFGEVRFPLNINDADLHPDMIEAPTEHTNPTEMRCVLMKFELFNWLRFAPSVTKVFDNIITERSDTAMVFKDEAINELETMYQEKYLRKSDKRIPLHALTQAMASLMIARMRFKAHHPRGRSAVADGAVYLAKEQNDTLFNAALTSLEMVSQCMNSKFSSHLFAHMTSSGKLQMDSYIYVISELRQRGSGDRVSLAWQLVEDLYDEHPELIHDTANTFYAALAGLTMEAWDARRSDLVRNPAILESHITPRFVQLLHDRRNRLNVQNEHIHTAVSNALALDDLGSNYANNLDWEYWNDFLTL